MKKLFTLVALLFFVVTTHTPAEASDLDWAADYERLKALKSEKNRQDRCQKTWDILWAHVKNENAQALMALAIYVAPPPHGSVIFLPGRDQKDLQQRWRDILAIGMYALKYFDLKAFQDDVSGTEEQKQYMLGWPLLFLHDDIFKQAFPDAKRTAFGDEALLKCTTMMALQRKSLDACIDPAIEKGYIASFDDFVKDIDDAIANGAKPICSFGDGRFKKQIPVVIEQQTQSEE